MKLGLRVTPELKERLDAAAEASGRSQSQEAEFRLDRSFDRNDLLSEALTLAYGREIAGLLLLLGPAMYESGRFASALAALPDKEKHAAVAADPAAWADSPYAYEQIVRAALKVLDALRPKGDPAPPRGSSAEVTPFTPAGIADILLACVAGSARSSALSETDAAKVRELLGDLIRRIKVEGGKSRE